jgi:hypothetical protein
MRILFFLTIVFLLMIPRGGAEENTPIGERIWKREMAADTKVALMIAVTLKKGDDLAKQIAPFKEVTKTWWRQDDGKKNRLFLMSVIDEETRPDEVRKIVTKAISEDEALQRIFRRVSVASLVFGTPEGKTLSEVSLKAEDAPKR